MATIIDTTKPLSAEVRAGFASYISDEYKGLHGVRPRFANFDTMSDADLVQWADRIADAVDFEYAREREREAEDNARIAEVCASLGIDRDTYDRWMQDLPEEW
jgi:hypothetical protein